MTRGCLAVAPPCTNGVPRLALAGIAAAVAPPVDGRRLRPAGYDDLGFRSRRSRF